MSLLTAYHNIVREADEKRKLKKVLLREKMINLREAVNNSRENEPDPLLIFPKEIWVMIQKSLTAANDRSSFFQTCQLFEMLMDEHKVELLFGKVLPILFVHLGKKTAKRCRSVCKMWRFGVDTYLENYHLVDTPPRDIVDYLKGGGDTLKGTMELFEFLHINPKYSKKKKDQSVNTLLGGGVELVVEYESKKLPDNWKKLLQHHGHRILKLYLNGDKFSQSFPYISQVCYKSLLYCPNLRSLHLESWGCKTWSPQEIFEIREDLQKMNHPELESITVYVKFRQFLAIQDKLLVKYSRQLKQVVVSFWNTDLYQHLNWGNLEELEVTEENCSELLEKLKLLRAPKLRKLSLRLDKSGPKLENIFALITQFPKLDHLCLRISHHFSGFSSQDIASISPAVVCSISITTLELTARTKEFCYDFLICFPFIKQLILVKGGEISNRYNLFESNPTEENDSDSDRDIWSEFWDSSPSEPGSVLSSEQFLDCNSDREEIVPDPDLKSKLWNGTTNRYSRDTSDDLIQLSQYLPLGVCYYGPRSRLEHLHQSNIWLLFPCLKTINIYHISGVVVNEEGRKVYNRELYEWRSMSKADRVKTHMFLNEKRLAYQKAWKKKEQKARISDVRSGMTPRRTKCPLPIQFKNIFPKIFRWLQKEDVLNCRLVCKKICVGVDEFLETYFCVNDRTKEHDHHVEYKFHFRATPSIESPRGHDNFREAMKLHAENPFVGRSVTIFLEGPGAFFELNQFYDTFGKYIWHVRLCGRNAESFRICPIEYKNLFMDTFQKCPNIRSMCVSGFNYFWKDTDYDVAHDVATWSEKLEVPFLESLAIHDSNVEITPLLRKLIEFYGNQLKRLHVPCDLRSNHFPCLQKLTTLAPFTNSWKCPFRFLKAENLTSLETRLEEVEPKLKILIDYLYRFPKLETLRLQFSENFAGFSETEVMEVMTLSPKCIALPKLTKLEIVTKNNNISYEFFLLFPHLKTFVLRHGKGALPWGNLGKVTKPEEDIEETSSEIEFELEDVQMSSLDDSSEEESEEENEAKRMELSDWDNDDRIDLGRSKHSSQQLKQNSSSTCDKMSSSNVSELDQDKMQTDKTPENDMEQSTTREENEICKNDLESDYIQIAKYVRDDGNDDNDVKVCKEIYASKVWQVLPCLEILKVIHVIGNENKEESKILNYTRKGFEKFVKDDENL